MSAPVSFRPGSVVKTQFQRRWAVPGSATPPPSKTVVDHKISYSSSSHYLQLLKTLVSLFSPGTALSKRKDVKPVRSSIAATLIP